MRGESWTIENLTRGVAVQKKGIICIEMICKNII
jgi:hypothetical protein